MAFQYRQNMQQQVPEIAGIHVPKTRLISGIELLPPAIGIALALARADLLRGQALVLPLVDEAGELAGGPALFVDALRLDKLLHQAKLVVRVEDGEVGLQPHQFGMAAQHLRGDGVESAQPGRSEEHTSELQSLMRLSYAVF